MADKRIKGNDGNSFMDEEYYCEEIDQNEIEIIQLIGKGSFGSVYKANWRNKVVAVKLLSLMPGKGPLVEVIFVSVYKNLFIIIKLNFRSITCLA